jgi:hypothetical protein
MIKNTCPNAGTPSAPRAGDAGLIAGVADAATAANGMAALKANATADMPT